MPIVTDIGAGGEDPTVDEKLDLKKLSEKDDAIEEDDDVSSLGSFSVDYLYSQAPRHKTANSF